MDKKQLSERDICTKCITPAIERAGWSQAQFREEVKLTDGRVMVHGKLAQGWIEESDNAQVIERASLYRITRR
jgi:type I site-specific restriction endonuclease